MTDKRIVQHLRSEEAEKAVISACLTDRDTIPRIELVAEDFTTQKYKDIFAAIMELYEGDEIIDPYALMYAGFDPMDIAAITDDLFVTSVYAEHYAKIVKRYSVLREYVRISEQLLQQAYTAGQEPDTLYTWLQGQLAVIGSASKHDAVMNGLASLDFYRGLLERRSEPLESGDGDWSWAWPSWNNRMDPLDAGMLCVVAARQGSGKTVIAEMLAEQWAKAGNRVAFLHFELNRDLMFDRRMARHTGIARTLLKQGNAALSPEQLRITEAAENKMAEWVGNIHYIHCPGWTMAHAMRVCEKLDVDAVVVDYLNKAAASSKQVRLFGSDKNGRLADDVETVKSAMERNYWRGILLAQFSKDGKRNSDPTAEDIRGSGEIADKANVIVLMNRERTDIPIRDYSGVIVAEPGMYGPHTTVNIDKNTMGVGGQIEQYFHGPTYSLHDNR